MARTRKQPINTSHSSKAAKQQIIWYIAAYIRLSREDDNANESDSVINQKKILQEYIEQFFVGQYVIVDFYVDDGLTGTDASRENFMRMTQDIERGKVNCVICKTLSRAFRNYSDQGYYLEYYFPQKNVRFISTGDPKIDTHLNPEAITGLEVPITGLMNDRFAAKTSSDIRRTFATKRRNGEFIGAFPPYGYLKDPQNKNHLILDEEIVPIKRDIYRWLVHEGMSLRGIALKLNELGIPNPTAYKHSKGWNYCNPNTVLNDSLWTGSTVRRILLDQMNLGHMVQGKQRVVSYKVHEKVAVPEDEWEIVHDTHEATFTQEEYENIVRVLQRDTRTPNGKRQVHLFSGFLRCYDCNKALHRRGSKGIVYYACRTYSEKSKEKCTKHSIREDILEAAVLSSIQTQVALLDSLRVNIDEINLSSTVNTQSQRIERLLQEKARELEKTQNRCEGLYDDWKDDTISRETYDRLKARYAEKAAQLQSAIAKLEEERQRMEKGADSKENVFAVFLKHRSLKKLDRDVLIELVDTIFVHEDKELTIVYRYDDELKRVFEFVELNRSTENAA